MRMDARTALLSKNIIASFLIKGWSAAVVFLLAPVTLMCLGQYANGVWMTISTMMVWIDTMDIGLGNGLRNKLSTSLAHGNRTEAREMVSTAFFMLIAIILPALAVLLTVLGLVDVYALLNVSPDIVNDLPTALAAALILIGGSFVFKSVGNFYMGLQLPAVNNLLVTAGQTLTLAMTYVCWYAGWHSLLAIAVVNTLSPLLVWIVAYVYTFYARYKDMRPDVRRFRMSALRGLVNVSVSFFVIQVSGIVLFFTTNVLISVLFEPSEVTPYNLAYRYLSLVMVLATVLFTPFWNATTDAFERGDREWIVKIDRKLNMMMLAMLALLVVMVALSPVVYEWWINRWQSQDVVIPFRMTLLMAVYMLIVVWSCRYSFILNGMGALRIQLFNTLLAALLFIPLVWLAVRISGRVEWIIVVLCVVNLPSLVCNCIQFRKIINNRATGIWSIR